MEQIHRGVTLSTNEAVNTLIQQSQRSNKRYTKLTPKKDKIFPLHESGVNIENTSIESVSNRFKQKRGSQSDLEHLVLPRNTLGVTKQPGKQLNVQRKASQKSIIGGHQQVQSRDVLMMEDILMPPPQQKLESSEIQIPPHQGFVVIKCSKVFNPEEAIKPSGLYREYIKNQKAGVLGGMKYQESPLQLKGISRNVPIEMKLLRLDQTGLVKQAFQKEVLKSQTTTIISHKKSLTCENGAKRRYLETLQRREVQEKNMSNFEFSKDVAKQNVGKALPINSENLYWKFEKVLKSALGQNQRRNQYNTILQKGRKGNYQGSLIKGNASQTFDQGKKQSMDNLYYSDEMNRQTRTSNVRESIDSNTTLHLSEQSILQVDAHQAVMNERSRNYIIEAKVNSSTNTLQQKQSISIPLQKHQMADFSPFVTFEELQSSVYQDKSPKSVLKDTLRLHN
ncbi:hypothetical protein FGO68_gene8294 [Halteria grandinella]|uniref:Uncharacterized protein n=1 Tax=Halteria grandinella TaxID=5974 RepID=A0A8J8T661_HALGN|nr:hypothetical protein FGO68_gene8294 [Halteria grandinella]